MKKEYRTIAITLRQKAEELLKKKSVKSDLVHSESEKLKLIHELEVHQIEMEMQNEELITAKEKAEVAVQKYTELYDFAPSGYFTLSREGIIIDLNLSGAKMVSRERSRLKNHLFSTIVSNDTKNYFNQFLDEIFISKEKESCEVTLIDKGNLPIHVLLSGIVTGKGEQCLLTAIDISDRRQAEAYLEMSQEILLILNEPEDIKALIQKILTSLKTRTGFDAVAIRLQEEDGFPYLAQKGFPEGFILNENALMFHSRDGKGSKVHEHKTSLVCSCGLVISGRTDHSNCLLSTGGSIWTNDLSNLLTISTEIHPWFYPHNKCINIGYASVALIPIRNKNKIIGQIQLNDKREGIFTSHAIEIMEGIASHIGSALIRKHMEEVLHKSESRLTELNATKDKFFKIISHDLKNPFISLIGASELLFTNIHRMDASNIKELALILNDSAKAGYSILENLLGWSRSQTGLLKFSPERINLKELIDENISNMELSAAIKEINLYSETENDIFIFADKNMINTVLRNLLGNALKFTFKNGKIVVSANISSGEVIISVKDTGIGIPEEKIEKLFSIGTSLSMPGTDNELGTGLGLKLSKEFVEKQNGKIWVKSTVNQGSEFIFSIPLRFSEEN